MPNFNEYGFKGHLTKLYVTGLLTGILAEVMLGHTWLLPINLVFIPHKVKIPIDGEPPP